MRKPGDQMSLNKTLYMQPNSLLYVYIHYDHAVDVFLQQVCADLPVVTPGELSRN